MLTYKQRRFIEEYINCDGNGTQAAIKAGYSENCAQQIATENLLKPFIMDAIKEREDQIAKAADETREKVIRDIRKICDSAITDDDKASALKALDMLSKVTGAYEVDNSQKKLDNIKIQFVGEDESTEET